MKAFAQGLLDGGKYTRADIMKFMKAYVDVDIQAGGPGLTQAEVTERYLPFLAFEIEKTDSGIHVPREVNRSYTKLEGAALLVKLAKALE